MQTHAIRNAPSRCSVSVGRVPIIVGSCARPREIQPAPDVIISAPKRHRAPMPPGVASGCGGADMQDPLAPLRAEVMAQPPEDRVEYALDLLRHYLDPVPPFFIGVHRIAPGLPPADVRVLRALDARRGFIVSMQSLIAARSLDLAVEDWAPPQKVVSCIAKLRRVFKEQRLPVEIITFTGLGYCLEAPEAFRFEDGVAPPVPL